MPYQDLPLPGIKQASQGPRPPSPYQSSQQVLNGALTYAYPRRSGSFFLRSLMQETATSRRAAQARPSLSLASAPSVLTVPTQL